MPLLIEDGSGVQDANSYITVDELRIFASDRGVMLPAKPSSGTDPAVLIYTPHLILANDYLESKRQFYIGESVFPAGLAWPRNYAYVNCMLLDYTTIPQAIKNAQAQLVLEQLRGIILQPSQAATGFGALPASSTGPVKAADGRFVTKKKIDVIETTYSDDNANGSGYIVPVMPAVDAFLRPLLNNATGFFTGVRI